MFYLPSVPRGTRKGLNQESCDIFSYMVSFYETTIKTDEKKETEYTLETSCRNFWWEYDAGSSNPDAIIFQAIICHFPKPVFKPAWLRNAITVANPEVCLSKLQNNRSIPFLSTSVGFVQTNSRCLRIYLEDLCN